MGRLSDNRFTTYDVHRIEEGLDYTVLKKEADLRKRCLTESSEEIVPVKYQISVTTFNLFHLPEQITKTLNENGYATCKIPRFPKVFFTDERLYPMLRKAISRYVKSLSNLLREQTGHRYALALDSHVEKILDNFVSVAQENKGDALRAMGALCNTVFIGPKIALFFPTQKCNLDCYYCDAHSPMARKDPWYKKFMSQAEDFDYGYIKKNLPIMKHMGIEEISLVGGGDPTIYPHFYDSLRLISHYGLQTNFSTNGIILRKEKMEDIIPHYTGSITVSISAVSGETYSIIHPRKTSSDFKRLKETLQEITRYRDRCENNHLTFIFLFVITPDNYQEIRKVPKFAKRLGFDSVHFQLLHLHEYTEHLRLHPKVAQKIRKDLTYAEGKCNTLGLEYMKQINIELEHYNEETGHYAESAFDRYGCLVGWYFTFLHRRGIVSLCCGNKLIDTVYEKDFKTLWHSPLYMEYRISARDWDTSATCLNGPLIDEFCRSCDNINFQDAISGYMDKLLSEVPRDYYDKR